MALRARRVNFPLPKSSIGGRIGFELSRLVEAVNSLRPISTDDEFVSVTTLGTKRVKVKRNLGGSTTSGQPEFGVVVEVLADTLMVEVASEEEPVEVQKPITLRVSGYSDYDSGVLDDFRAGLGIPSLGYPTADSWFSRDYIMKTSSAEARQDYNSDLGYGTQSRLRLVEKPLIDLEVTSPPGGAGTGLQEQRYDLLEVVWPPYRSAEQSPFEGSSAEEVLVQKIGGVWYDLNQHARRWTPEDHVAGEGQSLTMEVDGTRYLAASLNRGPQRA